MELKILSVKVSNWIWKGNNQFSVTVLFHKILFRLCYENKTLESTNSVETTTLKTLVEEDENKKETEFIHERNSSRKSSYLVISILVTFINGYIGNIVQSTFNSYLILWKLC